MVSELLAKRGPMGLRQMSRELGIPSASLHRILNDLQEQHVVERNEAAEWVLSFRLMQIVGAQIDRLRLPAVVRPFLEMAALETGETAFLAIPSGDEIVYIDMVRSEMQLQLNVELGTRRPMHCTGLGKAILAYLAPHRQRLFLSRREMPAYTAHTITDPMLLERELHRIRQSGFAIDREEIILGVHCVAVPLLNHTSRAVGAISVAGTSTRRENERFEALTQFMLKIGGDISARLGYVSGHDLASVIDQT